LPSSLNTFPMMATTSQDGGSPSPSVASQKSEPAAKKNAPSASMLKSLHTETSSRSRSSDDVAKFSPLVGRRSHGDSPLTASPLTRRSTTESTRCSSEKIGQDTVVSAAGDDPPGTDLKGLVSYWEKIKKPIVPSVFQKSSFTFANCFHILLASLMKHNLQWCKEQKYYRLLLKYENNRHTYVDSKIFSCIYYKKKTC
jgi:hypothetical protein